MPRIGQRDADAKGQHNAFDEVPDKYGVDIVKEEEHTISGYSRPVAGSGTVSSGDRVVVPRRICVLQHDGKIWVAYDDVTGLELDADKVFEARLK